MNQGSVFEVLQFWFDELEEKNWFRRDEKLDQDITNRFCKLWEAVQKESPEELTSEAKRAVASVIVLDQFPRNMFRGQKKAFSTDELALAVSRLAIEKGFLTELTEKERLFLLMPFQHSENPEVQKKSEELFGELGDENALAYAQEHKRIIDQFGRFPHRNKTLSRENTAEESEFLKHHKGF